MVKFFSLEAKNKLLNLILPLTYEGDALSISTAQHLEISDLIFDELFSALDFGCLPNYGRSYCHSLAQRVHEFLIVHHNSAKSLTEISQTLNAPVRSIQKGFKDLYGVGIVEFHRLYRIGLARKAICKRDGKVLQDIMSEYGFIHAGRFSELYRRVYGIQPSVDIDHTKAEAILKV